MIRDHPIQIHFENEVSRHRIEQAIVLLHEEIQCDVKDRAPYVNLRARYLRSYEFSNFLEFLRTISDLLNDLALPVSIDLENCYEKYSNLVSTDDLSFTACCEALTTVSNLSLKRSCRLHNLCLPDTLESLSLYDMNNITYADCAQLVTLKKLNLPVVESDVGSIRTLMQSLENLTSLSLKISDAMYFDRLIAFLDSARSTKLAELTLDLSSDFIMNEDQVAELGRVVSSMPHVEKLNFSWRRVCQHSPRMMAQLIEAFGGSSSISKLVLGEDNAFESIEIREDVECVANAIGTCQHLKEIVLVLPAHCHLRFIKRWSEGIAASSVTAFDLYNHFPSIENLERFIDSLGLKIEVLDLRSSTIDVGDTPPEVFKGKTLSIAETIAHWPKLRELSLAHTYWFKDAEPLRVLRESTSLKTLDIWGSFSDHPAVLGCHDQAILYLASFPALESLESDLRFATPQRVRSLARLKTLKHAGDMALLPTDEASTQALIELSKTDIETLRLPNVFASEEVARLRCADFPTDDDAANGLVEKVRRASAILQGRLLKYAPFWVKGQFSSQLQKNDKLSEDVIEHIFSFLTKPSVPKSDALVLTYSPIQNAGLLGALENNRSSEHEASLLALKKHSPTSCTIC
jgi:hypothetical protein